MKKCLRCNTPIKGAHPNRKRCEPCAAMLRKSPAGKLTTKQERMVRRLAGTMFIKDLAKKVGTSDSNLDRWARDNKFDINALKYSDEEIAIVCAYYAKHGKTKTQKKFPKVRVRSIVERHYKTLNLPARCTPWTDEQLVQLARFGGIASFTEIANYFKRPRAFNGSIQSVWMKRFGHGCRYLNGAPYNWAHKLVTNDCPLYTSKFCETRLGPQKIYLWIDLEKHLLPEIPDHISSAIKSLAKFQRWLHGKNYRANIMRILRGIE